MSGTERAFDDARWPTLEGKAECFLCGRKIDPLDPLRGSYTPNHLACDGLPLHLPCANGKNTWQIQTAALTAMTQMTEANLKQALKYANVSTTPPVSH